MYVCVYVCVCLYMCVCAYIQFCDMHFLVILIYFSIRINILILFSTLRQEHCFIFLLLPLTLNTYIPYVCMYVCMYVCVCVYVCIIQLTYTLCRHGSSLEDNWPTLHNKSC